MSVEVKTVGDAKIVVVLRRFDAYTASQVETELTKLVAEGAKKIVCDFGQTEYLASAGLRVLITASKSLARVGGKIVLCCVKPYVMEVFEISGLNRIFKMYPTVDEAVAALA
ncbi:MAG TPA: STAS domain-containing protein [Candidatus Acidoferrales bacterium]|nr:STAS domain-containing protein [Candidatus Acidoferrales bacterium]